MSKSASSKSKHQKQADVLVERIKKAREDLWVIFLDKDGKRTTGELMKARRELEIAMFGFGVHYAEYACDCYKRAEV